MEANLPRFGPDADLHSLDQEQVLAHFDACTAAGVIKFDQDFITKMHTVDGIEFEFRISQALMSKPHETSAPLASTLGTMSSKPRPGSDLMTAGTEVAALGPSHFLAFSGFSCYRPHYLMLTNDGHRRQWEPLDEEDFTAVHALLDSRIVGEKSGRGQYLVFFNGGIKAGCSRIHKHLQAIPQESYGGDPWRNLDRCVLPFGYFEKHFDNAAAFSPQDSLRAYREGIAAVERTIGPGAADVEGGTEAPAHSLLMDRERMVIIPRVAPGTGGEGANAAGMLGMVWPHSQENLEKWLEIGPQNILKAAGVAHLSR